MPRLKRRKKRFLGLKILFLIVVIFFTFISCAALSYNYIIQYQNQIDNIGQIVIPQNKQIVFDIPEGARTKDIAQKLLSQGLIQNANFFSFWSKIQGYDGDYKAGKHILSNELSMEGIMIILTSTPIAKPAKNVRFFEGKTYLEARELMAANGSIDPKMLDAVVTKPNYDYKFLKDLPDRKYKLEGYLYPQTYSVEDHWTAEQIVNRALEHFNKLFIEEYYKRAETLNMTVDQVITLASLIESEAKFKEDMPLIASVFHNRMKQKMPLQSCVTVQYARIEEGLGRKEVLSNDDTKINHPYNTYNFNGLPPGPVCSPGIDAIKAALYPEETNYLYFFAKPDGYHEFNKSHDDHINGMRKYGL